MPTRRARMRRKIYAKLPRWIKQHDFEVFAAFLGIIAGLPILFGQVQPSSPEDLLPRPIVFLWSATLVFGSIAVMAGVILGSRHVFPERVFWMRVEALGLTALAYFCYLYAFCVIIVSVHSGWTGGVIILAFGAVSHVREVAILMEIEQYRKTLGLEEKA